MTLSLVQTPTERTTSNFAADFDYRLITPSHPKVELQKIWQLVAGNLAGTGDVLPQDAAVAARNEQFDFHPATRVVAIYHQSGRLAGTFSITADSEDGMPISHCFAEELMFLRRKYRLMNGWRFSMSAHFQSSILRQRSTTLFKQLVGLSKANAFVIYYNKRLERYYHRMFNGRVMATANISFDGHNNLPVNMMLCPVEDNLPNPDYIHNGDLYKDAMVF